MQCLLSCLLVNIRRKKWLAAAKTTRWAGNRLPWTTRTTSQNSPCRKWQMKLRVFKQGRDAEVLHLLTSFLKSFMTFKLDDSWEAGLGAQVLPGFDVGAFPLEAISSHQADSKNCSRRFKSCFSATVGEKQSKVWQSFRELWFVGNYCRHFGCLGSCSKTLDSNGSIQDRWVETFKTCRTPRAWDFNLLNQLK